MKYMRTNLILLSVYPTLHNRRVMVKGVNNDVSFAIDANCKLWNLPPNEQFNKLEYVLDGNIVRNATSDEMITALRELKSQPGADSFILELAIMGMIDIQRTALTKAKKEAKIGRAHV